MAAMERERCRAGDSARRPIAGGLPLAALGVAVLIASPGAALGAEPRGPSVAFRAVPTFFSADRFFALELGGIRASVRSERIHVEGEIGLDLILPSINAKMGYRAELRGGTWIDVLGAPRVTGVNATLLALLGLAYYSGESPEIFERQFFDIRELDAVVAAGSELHWWLSSGFALSLRLLATASVPIALDDGGYGSEEDAKDLGGIVVGYEGAVGVRF